VVHFEAAIAVANGLSHDQAIRSLTIDAAKLLGIDDKVGSVEIGKDADLALFDGDPFEYITNTSAVIINGEVVYRAE
jgi:imidazolonepropionase-like amidohydrolase